MPNRKLVLWVIIALFALVLLVLSVGCLGLALLVSSVRAIEIEQRDLSAVIMACTGIVGGAMAIVLLLSGFEVWLVRPSPTLYPRRAWITWLAVLGFSVAGGLLLARTGRFDVVIAPFHVALIAVPAVLFYTFTLLAAGCNAGVSRRQATLMFTSGALSTLPAIPLELVGLLFSGLMVAFGAALIPEGQAELEQLALQLEQWSQLAPETLSPDVLTTLLASPIVLAVAFITLAVITPIVEEVFKTVALVAIGFRKRPHPLQAFLWGAVAGIGFAVIEGIFNSVASLTDAVSWASGIGSRLPATAMHAFTSGLIGLGWGYFWRGRKRWLVPLCYAASILFHGLWNFSVIAVAGTQSLLTTPVWLSGATAVIGVLVIGLLAILALVGTLVLPLLLRTKPTQPKNLSEN